MPLKIKLKTDVQSTEWLRILEAARYGLSEDRRLKGINLKDTYNELQKLIGLTREQMDTRHRELS